MGGDRRQVRYLGLFVLGVILTGLASAAAVYLAFPPARSGVMRLLLPLFIVSAAGMAALWMVLAVAAAISSLLKKDR